MNLGLRRSAFGVRQQAYKLVIDVRYRGKRSVVEDGGARRVLRDG